MRRLEVGLDAAPAGRGQNASPRSRAAPGLRPGALRPPARSSLTAGRNARQKARPGAVWTLRWRAERRHTFARRCELKCNGRAHRRAIPSTSSRGSTPPDPLFEGDGNGLRRTRRRQEYGRRSVGYIRLILRRARSARLEG